LFQPFRHGKSSNKISTLFSQELCNHVASGTSKLVIVGTFKFTWASWSLSAQVCIHLWFHIQEPNCGFINSWSPSISMQFMHHGVLTMFLNSMIFSIPYLNQGPFINISHLNWHSIWLPSFASTLYSIHYKRKKVVICSLSLAIFQPEKFNFDINTQISMKRNWLYFEKRKKKSPLFSIPTTICEKCKNENQTFNHMSSDFIFSHGNFLQIFSLKKIWFMT
jgi:hypothetical protein